MRVRTSLQLLHTLMLYVLVELLCPLPVVYLLVRGSAAAGPDARPCKLVLVGVYPVVDGYAQVDMKEMANKGQSCFSPLYIVPGEYCPSMH